MGAKLLFALLAAATSCHTFYYGTSYDLSKKGRVIAWPVDEQGEKFRYTIDHIPKPIREGRIYDLAVGNGPIRAKLPEPVDSVLIVLPPEPEPAQRKAAEHIVDWVVQQDGSAAAHIIVGFEPWTFVLSVGQLEQSLAKVEERTAHRLGKHHPSSESMFMEMIAPLFPIFIVVPVTQPEEGFVVAQANYSDKQHTTTRTMTAAEVVDLIVANYKPPKLGDENMWGEIPPIVHCVAAYDVPPQMRLSCADLVQQISRRTPAAGADRAFMVVFRTTSVGQAELNREGAIESLANSGGLLPFSAAEEPEAE